MPTLRKFVRSASLRLAALPLAAILGVVLGACAHGQSRINRVCDNYCQRLLDCNDNADYDDCFDACLESADDCDTDDDTANALDILEECTADSCNQVIGCTVEAWLECAL